MTEQQTLKQSVMSDPNILAFLVYADYLDENNQDSSMWRNPYSPIMRMVVDGSSDSFNDGGGSGSGSCGEWGNYQNVGGDRFNFGGGHGDGNLDDNNKLL